MRRLFRNILLSSVPAFASCATEIELLSHWIHYPRTSQESREAAGRTLRELGYTVDPDSPDAPGTLRARFSADGRIIHQQIEVQPAGGESEIRVFTRGPEGDAQTPRTRNAYERLVGELDAALRKKDEGREKREKGTEKKEEGKGKREEGPGKGGQ